MVTFIFMVTEDEVPGSQESGHSDHYRLPHPAGRGYKNHPYFIA